MDHLEQISAIVQACEVTDGVAERFLRYSWPGNIRELRNTVESAFAVAKGDVLTEEDVAGSLGAWTLEETPAPATVPGQELPEGFSLTQALERYERELLRRAMSQMGSISGAARLLGISRQNLKYKLQKFDL